MAIVVLKPEDAISSYSGSGFTLSVRGGTICLCFDNSQAAKTFLLKALEEVRSNSEKGGE